MISSEIAEVKLFYFITGRIIVVRAQDHHNRRLKHSSLRLALDSGAHEFLQADPSTS
jgi:hypothetical protein